jgi:hypothetical protein
VGDSASVGVTEGVAVSAGNCVASAGVEIIAVSSGGDSVVFSLFADELHDARKIKRKTNKVLFNFIIISPQLNWAINILCQYPCQDTLHSL